MVIKKSRLENIADGLLDFIYMFAAPSENVKVMVSFFGNIYAVVTQDKWEYSMSLYEGYNINIHHWKVELQEKMKGNGVLMKSP